MKNATQARIDIVKDTQRLEREVIGAAYQFHNLMGQRPGQALMNALRHKAPELYDILSGTPHDCFYDDSKLADTMMELGFSRKLFDVYER